ncbi:uncharacterized protein LOC122498767 [Leptopilina heterotoma]|uniref:uncharacterized protein LOC122498767 n=1 Tax=Leptopilina heterotoma TaxID=63436 RepID=UPI001CA94258|nr:uncharacterized protein LOC122498767 [Leptopilina heterotoma]
MYMSVYKVLQQPLGFQLIDEDFKQMHQNKSDALNNEWDSFEKEIIGCAKTRKSSEISALLAVYNLINDDTDASVAVIFRLIPLLLPTLNVRGSSKKRVWKLSKPEVQDAFVMHITVIIFLIILIYFFSYVFKIYKMFKFSFNKFHLLFTEYNSITRQIGKSS